MFVSVNVVQTPLRDVAPPPAPLSHASRNNNIIIINVKSLLSARVRRTQTHASTRTHADTENAPASQPIDASIFRSSLPAAAAWLQPSWQSSSSSSSYIPMAFAVLYAYVTRRRPYTHTRSQAHRLWLAGQEWATHNAINTCSPIYIQRVCDARARMLVSAHCITITPLASARARRECTYIHWRAAGARARVSAAAATAVAACGVRGHGALADAPHTFCAATNETTVIIAGVHASMGPGRLAGWRSGIGPVPRAEHDIDDVHAQECRHKSVCRRYVRVKLRV